MKRLVEIQMHTLEDLLEWHTTQADRAERLLETHKKKWSGYGKYGDTVLRQDVRKVEFHRMAAAVAAKAIEDLGGVNVQVGRSPDQEPVRCAQLASTSVGISPEPLCVPQNGPKVSRVPEADQADGADRPKEDRLPSVSSESTGKRTGFHWPSTGT
jgi:hypothetical protein